MVDNKNSFGAPGAAAPKEVVKLDGKSISVAMILGAKENKKPKGEQ